MVNLNLLKTLHEEGIQGIPQRLFLRKTPLKQAAGFITSILGPRRSGKTFYLFEQIKTRLDAQVEPRRILYLNFEDDRLPDLNAAELGQWIDGFYELYPENHDEIVYFYFDEIQNVEDWSTTLRRVLDKKKCEIVITGSSSRMLSKELASALRGRALAQEILPFDFFEFLKTRGLTVPSLPLSRRRLDETKKQLGAYLEMGGFPSILLLPEGLRLQVHREYYDLLLFRDVIERHAVANTRALDYIAKFSIKNYGRLYSGTKLFRDLKSQGYSVSKDTIYDYMEYLVGAYLIFQVPLYTESIRKQRSHPQKLFLADTGLPSAFELTTAANLGRKFENLIYLDLRRSGAQVHYYLTHSGREVDFVVTTARNKLHLIQVYWDLTELGTLEREESALLEARSELDCDGMLVTPNRYVEFLDKLNTTF